MTYITHLRRFLWLPRLLYCPRRNRMVWRWLRFVTLRVPL